jgi:UDP-glucose 4-epimerase
MRALVIGGNGFIGSHLVDKLLESGWEVSVFDLHDRRFDSLSPKVKFFRGDFNQLYLIREALVGVDVVFLLAWTTIHEVSNQDPVADIFANLAPTVQVIDACTKAGVGRVIFTSSGGTVYGPAQDLPIPESHPERPVTSYGITKLAAEKYLYLFNHLYGLDFAILRPSVPYGPRQNPLGRQGAANVFLYRVMHDLPITIWGDGSVTRDFFYIADLVDALVACASERLNDFRTFNIGGREEVSLINLINRVEDLVGKKAKINSLPARAFDAQRVVLDTNLAEQELGWEPKVNLDRGLALTWQWLGSHYRKMSPNLWR